uniref:SPFH domain-containing protein n=1 Tax=Ndongobacter massiliensis TaxID=1871025 RepID=UPI0009308F99|nr:SPFH domain-containing protein [Ndongobacter massiliensis]
MGFLQAFRGAIGGTFADQWKDFYGPMPGVSATAAIFPGFPMGVNNNRGANYKGNENVITNGTKVIVPEGTALITIQDGAITNIITEVGGYEYNSNDPNSKSIFAGDGIIDSIVKTSWEKFKFGGIPATNQLLFYVNLKEIPNNRFGTQSEIYWDDAFFGTQVGAVTRGTYTLKIVDPILFVKNFVPVKYLISGAEAFDLSDMDNEAAEQLFNEVVGSLSAAFSNYTNDPSRGNRMSRIQGDQIGFAKSLSLAVEEGYQWKTSRGLEIAKTAILAIEYDEDTKVLMSDVKKADALSGSRGNAFFQQAAARGMQSAGENGGGANMAFMGMGMNAAGNMMSGVQQPETASSYQPNFGAVQGNQNQQPGSNSGQQSQTPNQNQGAEDPTEKLIQMKKLFDAGVISEEEFKKIKFDLLGL